MRFDVEQFLSVTASLALGVACAQQKPAAAPPSEPSEPPAVVAVPTPEDSEPASDEELVAVVDENASDSRDEDPKDFEDASTEGAPYDEAAVLGALTGGPMLEGGFIGVKGFGSGAGGLGLRGIGSAKGSGKLRPKVRVGTASTRGQLDRAVIQRVVRRKISRIRACYNQELVSGKPFNAKIVTRFIIGKDGRVKTVTLSKTSRRPKLDNCVKRAFRAMMFPAPKGGLVTVSYPLIFNTK